MALQAIIQSEMGLALMATAARRDDILVARGVADMAVLTGDLVAVGHAIALQCGDDGRMALRAIIQGELCQGWRLVAWLGQGLVRRPAGDLQAEKHRACQNKIFGCKYQLAYYYLGDVGLRRWGGHFVVFVGGGYL